LKPIHFTVNASLLFTELTLADAKKLEQFLRDGIQGQKGFKNIFMELKGAQDAPPADGKVPTGRKGIVQ
jgi:hypothetical protein